MNKIVNIFSLILLITFTFFTVGSLYDLGFSVYKVNDIPYVKAIVSGLSFLVLILGIIRIKRRWEGKKDISKFSKFTFHTAISRRQKKQASLFIAIEVIFACFFVIIFTTIMSMDEHYYVLPMLIIVLFLAIENLIYLILFLKDNKTFQIGISDQLIAYFDREMHLYYYDGLQRIEIYQDMINFKYKKDLNLFLNLQIVPEKELYPFLDKLKTTLESKHIFFDDSFHQYLNQVKH